MKTERGDKSEADIQRNNARFTKCNSWKGVQKTPQRIKAIWGCPAYLYEVSIFAYDY